MGYWVDYDNHDPTFFCRIMYYSPSIYLRWKMALFCEKLEFLYFQQYCHV